MNLNERVIVNNSCIQVAVLAELSPPVAHEAKRKSLMELNKHEAELAHHNSRSAPANRTKKGAELDLSSSSSATTPKVREFASLVSLVR